jgi:hypothetical protein
MNQMAEALKVAPAPAPIPLFAEVRRFDLPDIDRHGAWFLPRFLKEYPHINERAAIGFIKAVLYSNEFLFLFQEKAVALFQAVGSGGLEPQEIIWERFVWLQDPNDVQQQQAAAQFYVRALKWAQQKGVEIVHTELSTDVPRDTIKAVAGRVFETTQAFLRVKGA